MNTDRIYAESIAKEYAPKDTSKVVALRKLDRKARLGATVFTYTFGIAMALVLGVGMCLAMGVIGGGSSGRMNKNESKYFSTASLMNEALILLLEAKEFEYITVKEICEKAGVNRSTFYLHYDSVSNLLVETMEKTLSDFIGMFPTPPESLIPAISDAPLDELIFIKREYLSPYLTFVRENKSVIRAAFKNPVCLKTEKQMEDVSKYVLMPILHRFSVPETDQPYWVSFFIHGCMAVMRTWMENDCRDPVEKIERIIIDCIQPSRGLAIS